MDEQLAPERADQAMRLWSSAALDLLMPFLTPTPIPFAAIQFTSVPDSGNACQLIRSDATAKIVFKTAAFDRSATPPRQ